MPDESLRPPSEAFIKGAYESMKGRAIGIKDQVGPGYGNKKLTLDDKLAIWNERKLTIEQEWDLWRQGNTPETAHLPKLSPEEIGMKVFEKREQLVKSGGNIEPELWIKEAGHLAAEAEKRRRVEQPQFTPIEAEGPVDVMEPEPMGEEIAAPALPGGSY